MADREISIKDIGIVSSLNEAKTAYFLASLVSNDGTTTIWNTKNIAYSVLSNDVKNQILEKVPAVSELSNIQANITYISQVSTAWNDASQFANYYANIGNFLSGFNLTENNGLSNYITQISNEITDNIEIVSNNVKDVSDTVTAISIDLYDNVSSDVSVLSTSVDTIYEKIDKLNISTIIDIVDSVNIISDDIYKDETGEFIDTTGDNNILQKVKEHDDDISEITTFIDPDGTISEKYNNLSTYITKLIDDNKSSSGGLATTITQMLNCDSAFQNYIENNSNASLGGYIRQIIKSMSSQ